VKKSNWSKTANIIQNIDETTAAKAIYSQFVTKTVLVELKITEGGRTIRVVVSWDDSSGRDDEDDEDGSGPIVLFFLFCLLK
jgi:hypothetical protein